MPSSALTRALGFVHWDAVRVVDRSAGPMAKEYFDIVRREGMAEHVCDRTIVFIPMVTKGDFPPPNFMLASNWECQPNLYSQLLVAKLLNVPHKVLDRKFVPFNKLEDDAQLKYLVRQLENVIDYVETTFPGLKYNEERLVELQNYNREYLKYEKQLWKLRAAIPCPLSGKEALGNRRPEIPEAYYDPGSRSMAKIKSAKNRVCLEVEPVRSNGAR